MGYLGYDLDGYMHLEEEFTGTRQVSLRQRRSGFNVDRKSGVQDFSHITHHHHLLNLLTPILPGATLLYVHSYGETWTSRSIALSETVKAGKMNPDTDVLLGPILIGSLLAYMLMGAYLVQLYHYLTEDPIAGPRIRLHILVALVTAAEVTNVVFISQACWRICIQSTQHPDLRVVLPVTAPGIYALNGMIPLMVQCFFAWQIMRITRRKRYVRIRYIIPALIVALALLQTTALFVVAAKFVQFGRRARFLGRLEIKFPAALYLSASLACDTLITTVMIFILLDFKAATELSTTKRLLNMLIFNAVENGAITTICAALNLGFYLARPLDYIHLCFAYAIGGLYANVLLASLNGRGRRAETWNDRSTNLREIEFRGEVTFRNLGDGSSSTRSNRHSGLTDHSEARAGKGGGAWGLGKVQSPPPPFLVSTVTEVHRDGDFIPRARD